MLAAAEATGARLVSMENVYMYGRPAGRPLTEDRDYAAHTKKGRLRGRMARELLAAHAAGRVEVAIGRASDYFGPRGGAQSNLGDRLVPAALAGTDRDRARRPRPAAHLHLHPDIGEGLAVLGEHPDAPGQVWHLPNDPHTRTTRQLVDLVYRLAGRPRTRLRARPPLLLRRRSRWPTPPCASCSRCSTSSRSRSSSTAPGWRRCSGSGPRRWWRRWTPPSRPTSAGTGSAQRCGRAVRSDRAAADQPMGGRVVLVTGGTSGIGRATAEGLSALGAHVAITGRDARRTQEAADRLARRTGRPVLALAADLSSQAQVRRLAEDVRRALPRLDVLVNNAGGCWSRRHVTADGLEHTFALNHLAPFLLTHLLLDRLRASAPGSGRHRRLRRAGHGPDRLRRPPGQRR